MAGGMWVRRNDGFPERSLEVRPRPDGLIRASRGLISRRSVRTCGRVRLLGRTRSIRVHPSVDEEHIMSVVRVVPFSRCRVARVTS